MHTLVHILSLYILILIQLPQRVYDNIYQLMMFLLDYIWLYTKLLTRISLFPIFSEIYRYTYVCSDILGLFLIMRF